MKAIGILGTSSNAGKSWFATALCAWLRKQGVNVAPFKAQNMSNNACATLDGGEIGIAQAVQSTACGLTPRAEMNPILLKPAGDSTSQIIRLGKAIEHIEARDYYRSIDQSWQVVRDTLDWWKGECDVLVMEGAGSPVELNIVDRDIANLRPIRYVDGKWILVADIERGGVFAQVAGTYALCAAEDRTSNLGYIINRFRGDTSLFPNPEPYLQPHCEQRYLGLLPLLNHLQIDEEDSLCMHNSTSRGNEPSIAWIRLPHISNSQDIQAWRNDTGVHVHWATTADEIAHAAAIVIPGTKNTLKDLEWLKANGLDHAIQQRAAAGVPVVGICGGYQMLGTQLTDKSGVAGKQGAAPGLGFIPMTTEFSANKTVTPRTAEWHGDTWETYEIHSGQSQIGSATSVPPLLTLLGADGNQQPEGACHKNIWGSYQHGLFDSSAMRQRLVDAANIPSATISPIGRKAQAQQTFDAMADLLEDCMDLDAIKRQVAL
jgi:adenosylcobyric acid synthase